MVSSFPTPLPGGSAHDGSRPSLEDMSNQLDRWTGTFGDDYTQRNKVSQELIQKRAETLYKIISPLMPVSILEVGCNYGTNLMACLPFMQPPAVMVGVEPNEKARRIAEIGGLNVYPDCGQDLHFFSDHFDLVFTCGVLIHCELEDAEKIVKEMLRVARRHVLFMEYFNKVDEEIEYRGETGLLWKRNWPEHFRQWGLGKQVSCGFANASQGFDDVHWWVYKK